MPRRVITHPDHDRRISLQIAVWWIETFTVHGPGDVQGQPSLLVDEFADFIVDCYALDSRGKRLYDSAFFSRPKGCDKSGLAAKLVLFEAFGPCRFAGFAKGGETYEFLGQVYTYRRGEPMGKGITVPYIRIMATEEGQTGNVYDTVYYNLTDDAAPLSAVRAYGCDPGKTRIILPDGGEITPSTAGAASKDGGKETFVVFDESHLYVTPMLHQMYVTVTRNLIKRKKGAGTWFLETTTMYAPGQESVAEETYQLADKIQEKQSAGGQKYRNLRSNLLFDHRWGQITFEEMADEAKLAKAVDEAYGDALEWNSLEDIVSGIFDPRASPADSLRYYLNAVGEARNAWLSPGQVDAAVERSRKAEFAPVADGDTITLGFDGSFNDDSTALVACRVSDRHVFPLVIEQKPDDESTEKWEVDRVKVDLAVADAHRRYKVVGFYADPPLWQDYLDKWAREYGDDYVVHAGGKHSINWWTKRDTPMAAALERLHTALVAGTMSLAGRPGNGLDVILGRHFINARNWYRAGGKVIGKERKGSPFKIDAAMASALAFEATADYTAKAPKPPSTYVPIKVR